MSTVQSGISWINAIKGWLQTILALFLVGAGAAVLVGNEQNARVAGCEGNI